MDDIAGAYSKLGGIAAHPDMKFCWLADEPVIRELANAGQAPPDPPGCNHCGIVSRQRVPPEPNPLDPAIFRSHEDELAVMPRGDEFLQRSNAQALNPLDHFRPLWDRHSTMLRSRRFAQPLR